MSESPPIAQQFIPITTPRPRATFYGTTYHKVADKTNQVAIPKTLKDVIAESQEGHLVLIQYPEEPFLRLYTKKTFDQKMEEVKANPELSPAKQNEIVDWMAGESQVIEPDSSQGRFVLPKAFADKLTNKEVAFQGAFTFIKVWPAELHQATRRDGQKLDSVKDLVKGILDR